MDNLTDQKCFLVDNGSLRPASTLALRRVAGRLSARLAREVVPVSLLHSSKVSAADLGGTRASLLEQQLRVLGESGGGRAVVLPLFFGPSGALIDYIPEMVDKLRAEFPNLEVVIADCLENPTDDSAHLLARALQHEVARLSRGCDLSESPIMVTDHGTPLETVSAVRNRVGDALRQLSDGEVVACSMERREGPQYDFNEPLLENALRVAFSSGNRDAIVALQFLFAGRHAGPEGDVVQICRRATNAFPGTKTWVTSPIGESPEVLALLERRYDEAINQSSWTR